ncbi:hypothetical protein PGTUg99_031350 [Puccinia graminis f. sp. tritici]|uniref:Uncharacterized protein n=1 Tax=Puccinia graminis f. sp. tritici TaxID=56615 RepID=A0A5B0LWP4_PUCGR|nr:hypothetical protein PGTUg99_031350 [Puccinia graminis f. sp. tritici]
MLVNKFVMCTTSTNVIAIPVEIEKPRLTQKYGCIHLAGFQVFSGPSLDRSESLTWRLYSTVKVLFDFASCSQDHDSWLSPTAPRPHASRGPQLRRHEITPARRRTNESGTSAGQCVVRPLPALNGTNVTRTAPRTPTPKHTRVHPGLSRRLGRTPRKQVEDICRTFSRLRLQADSEAECHAPRSRSDVASKPTRKRPPT